MRFSHITLKVKTSHNVITLSVTGQDIVQSIYKATMDSRKTENIPPLSNAQHFISATERAEKS